MRARLPVSGVEGASPERLQGRGRMDWISGAYKWKRRAVLFAGLAAACYALGWYPASVGFCVGVVCGIWMERGVEKSETKEGAKDPRCRPDRADYRNYSPSGGEAVANGRCVRQAGTQRMTKGAPSEPHTASPHSNKAKARPSYVVVVCGLIHFRVVRGVRARAGLD